MNNEHIFQPKACSRPPRCVLCGAPESNHRYVRGMDTFAGVPGLPVRGERSVDVSPTLDGVRMISFSRQPRQDFLISGGLRG
jgi:hypothetical protein